MNDTKRIAALKRHDIHALESCIQRYTAYVSTILRNVLRSAATAADIEELTADVFVSLWTHAEQMQTDYLQGYLAAIARAKAYNWLRKQKIQTEDIDDVVISSILEWDNRDVADLEKAVPDFLYRWREGLGNCSGSKECSIQRLYDDRFEYIAYVVQDGEKKNFISLEFEIGEDAKEGFMHFWLIEPLDPTKVESFWYEGKQIYENENAK